MSTGFVVRRVAILVAFRIVFGSADAYSQDTSGRELPSVWVLSTGGTIA